MTMSMCMNAERAWHIFLADAELEWQFDGGAWCGGDPKKERDADDRAASGSAGEGLSWEAGNEQVHEVEPHQWTDRDQVGDQGVV